LSVSFTLRAKGLRGLTARVGTIVSRFALDPGRMERYLKHYVGITDRYGIRPTLPITASVLARHPASIAPFVERGVEFAIHGLVHNDHAVVGPADQRTSLAEAMRVFAAAQVPFHGFRSPYLRANAGTEEAARSLGLLYQSNQAVAFDVLPAAVTSGPLDADYGRALALYGALDATDVAVRPHDRSGLIDIPVAVPDDEIFVDRLRLGPEAQASAWLAILDTTQAHGDLFTVQLHPERIFDCAFALEAVLREARRSRPQVWMASLQEIARWWLRRGQARLGVRELGEDRFQVSLNGPTEATLLARGLDRPGMTRWHGLDAVVAERDFEVRARRKPVVGVSLRTPEAVLDFLREEGFPAERSDDPSHVGAHVDVGTETWSEPALVKEIEATPGPLVRLSRWPAEARSALAVTGDIDAMTLQDFAFRLWETRPGVMAARLRAYVAAEAAEQRAPAPQPSVRID
jgi:peptidoglycan/xylan/chitin deacetylase (PgdA/CDA1 family)